MADRGASAAVITQLGSARNQPIHLVRADFDSGTVYVTDAARPITWGGNSYIELGWFLGFDGLEESSDLRLPEVKVSLAGVDQTVASIVLAEDITDRRLRIWKGFLSAATTVVVDPFAIFDGYMSGWTWNEDPDSGESVVMVSASDRGGGQYERRRGRHTNHEEQQLHFAGDMIFEFVDQADKPMKWGAL